MIKSFMLSMVFLSACIFCNADNVEYQIIPLNSAGKEFDLGKKDPQTNSCGQTVGYDRLEDWTLVIWLNDPVYGKILLPKVSYYIGGPLFITEKGHVIGKSNYKLFIWSIEKGLHEITPSMGRCYLKAVNNNDEVVFDNYSRIGYYHASLIKADKTVISLGTLGGYVSCGNAINDFSEVVGGAEFSRQRPWERHAFIWDEKKGMRDLNSLIPQDSGWSELIEANYINNSGLIVGKGKYLGESCEFLLIPIE